MLCKQIYIITPCFLGSQTCKQHYDVENHETQERLLLLSQNQHADNEVNEEGMRS